MKTARKPSPQSVLLFLKQAALEKDWNAGYVASTLGVDRKTANEVTSQLVLTGYAEPVPRKRDSWRNTEAGNSVAGVRQARLTRKKAEEVLAGVADRASEINLSDKYPARIRKIVAFGAITTDHERLQDIDLGVQLEAKSDEPVPPAVVQAMIKAVKGGSAALKLHLMEQGLQAMPGRVVWPA